MAVKIVSLTARLGLDGSQFQQGLRNATQAAQRFAGGLGRTLGIGLGVGTLVAGIRTIASEIGRIKDLSEQFSATTDEVQRLDAAAKQSGQSFEQIGTAIEKLGAARKDAAEGNEELRSQFARFGVTLDELNNPAIRNIDLMQQMAKAIAKMNLTAADATAMRELFGRSGGRLAAVFADLEKVKPKLISPEDIQAIDDASKAWHRMYVEMLAAGAASSARVAEALTPSSNLSLSDRLKRLFTSTSIEDFAKKQQELRNPATAENPRARSSELVGPTQRGEDLFQDKQAAKMKKEAAELEAKIAEKILDIQFQMADATERRAILEKQITDHLERGDRLKALESLQALQGLPAGATSDLRGGVNVGQLGNVGMYTGLSLNRAMALAGSSEAKSTAESTRRTAENTARMIAIMTAKPRGGDELEF